MKFRVFGLILLISFTIVWAEPPDSAMEHCLTFHRTGEYQNAVDCINNFLLMHANADTMLLVKAMEYLGVNLVMLNQQPLARNAFSNLLDLNPGYELNPTVYLPEVVAAFQIAKFEKRTLLRVPPGVDTAPTYPLYVNFMPLGLPQFCNHSPVKGIFIGLFQTITMGVSIYAYQIEKSLESKIYKIKEENLGKANRFSALELHTFLLAIGGYMGSIIDGLINKPAVVRNHRK